MSRLISSAAWMSRRIKKILPPTLLLSCSCGASGKAIISSSWFSPAACTFATYLSAPFFAVFMLRDLQLSYVMYMALQVCASAGRAHRVAALGRHADLVGNVRVLRLSSFMVALIPVFWLFSQKPA